MIPFALRALLLFMRIPVSSKVKPLEQERGALEGGSSRVVNLASYTCGDVQWFLEFQPNKLVGVFDICAASTFGIVVVVIGD